MRTLARATTATLLGLAFVLVASWDPTAAHVDRTTVLTPPEEDPTDVGVRLTAQGQVLCAPMTARKARVGIEQDTGDDRGVYLYNMNSQTIVDQDVLESGASGGVLLEDPIDLTGSPTFYMVVVELPDGDLAGDYHYETQLIFRLPGCN